jgi:hypothetical protein
MASLLSSTREGYFGIKALLRTVAEDSAELIALQTRLNANPGIPVSNPTTSFWLQSPPFPDLVDKRSKTLPKTADIVIIGSGITGASIARTILLECAIMGINRRVVMLEARQACSGATGRNGGHIKCTPHDSFCEYKERFGPGRARALVDFQTSHLPILVDLAKQEKWDLAEASMDREQTQSRRVQARHAKRGERYSYLGEGGSSGCMFHHSSHLKNFCSLLLNRNINWVLMLMER